MLKLAISFVKQATVNLWHWGGLGADSEIRKCDNNVGKQNRLG